MTKRPDHLEIVKAENDAGVPRFYWRRVAGNGKKTGIGGESFVSYYDAVRAAKNANPGLNVVDEHEQPKSAVDIAADLNPYNADG